MDRRTFLTATGAGVLATGCPGLVLARASTDARLVVVLLRGALDGLAAVPPVGDPDYQRQRGPLAIPVSGSAGSALPLNTDFALHPALTGLHAAYKQQQLLVLHATATAYRARSHFAGQDWLETAVGDPQDGWLNRALAVLPGAITGEQGIALSSRVPLVLRGDTPVTSWAPSRLPEVDADTLDRIAMLYADDPVLSVRLAEARNADQLAGAMDGTGPVFGPQSFARLAEAAGRFLVAPDGPRVAVLETTGWDTHANQGAAQGQLANRLTGLDQGLSALRSSLGSSWRDTVVVIATEFGRTVAVNGSRGTDHGTASCALLLGGAVQGGRVLGEWPGLSAGSLYQGRDLRPTTDLRALLKGVLQEHLLIDDRALEACVFRDSRQARPLQGLIRV